MNISEKTRDRIIFALPELSDDKAERIAATEGCSKMTVYRHFKKLKGGDTEATPIVMALAELAKSKMPEAKKEHRRLLKIERQLSAA